MSGWLVYLSAAWFLNTRFSGCLKKKKKMYVKLYVSGAVRIYASLDQILRERETETETETDRQTDRQRQSLEWSEKVL